MAIKINLDRSDAIKSRSRAWFLGCLSSMILTMSTSTLAQQAPQNKSATTIKVASFNVSMEARNYVDELAQPELIKDGAQILMRHLATGKHPQIRNIAEIIQRVRPDIILLNEFDYIDNPKLGVEAFIEQYLAVGQQGAQPIDYPYYYVAPSNTGIPTTFDLDKNGTAERFKADAYGFGYYPGHYGMVLLSRYPILKEQVRTFQHFLWSDMPGALAPIDPQTKQPFYSDIEWHNLRLSSKSHWDVPVNINGTIIHMLASHPTPPVFDGDEDRNGRRNHDEIRFWLDYITPDQADYIYDDSKIKGGLNQDAHFVIVGDLNASPDRQHTTPKVIADLLASSYTNDNMIPRSNAGALLRPENDYAQYHTASWAARVDYALPSANLQVVDAGVFWPTTDEPLYRLIDGRAQSSDHYLVWSEISLE